MNPGDSDLDKLCKVLALTNSDKPGEAVAAFQSAKKLLLGHGLSFEDIVAQYFDDTGATPQKQIAALKKQKAALQRQLSEQAGELTEHKKAMKDLLDQLWELREGETDAPEPEEKALPGEPVAETIKETYRPNLVS